MYWYALHVYVHTAEALAPPRSWTGASPGPKRHTTEI